MAKTAKAPNLFTDRLWIVSMNAWDEEFIDKEQEGYIEFDQKGNGQFHFGQVHGQMTCHPATRDDEPALEWTWDGNDKIDSAQGRGWAVIVVEGAAKSWLVVSVSRRQAAILRRSTPTSRRGRT